MYFHLFARCRGQYYLPIKYNRENEGHGGLLSNNKANTHVKGNQIGLRA